MAFLEKLIGVTPKINWKISIMTIISTLVIMVDYYFDLFHNRSFQDLLLFLVIPLLIIILVFRESPLDFGVQFGDWKAGIVITLISVVLAAPMVWLAVRVSSSMQNYYAQGLEKLWLLNIILQLLGWEFLFRGWLLFGYQKEFGDHAIWLQAVPFALAHLSKPSIETLSTIFGGFFFGWVAWRTKSFLYPFIIHVFVSAYACVFSTLILTK